MIPVLLPADKLEVDGYGNRRIYHSKPRWACPDCHKTTLRMCDRASTGRTLKQTIHAV